MDFIFILSLFGVLAVSSLFVIVFGANVYTRITDSSDSNYKSRTAYYYVTEKIRSHDKAGTIEVRNTANTKSIGLIFYEYTEEGEYRTYIYYYNGYLWECTKPADEEFRYDEGTALLKLHDFKADIAGEKLIHLYLKDDNDYVTDFYITTVVPLKDVTDKPQIGSDGPEKQGVDKKSK